jgi:hypothetical protein
VAARNENSPVGKRAGRVDRAVLDREGEVWTIEFDGLVRHVMPLKGLDYLSVLLRHPGCQILSVELEHRAAPEGVREERARLNVTRAIQSVIGRLDQLHPSLADHLRATVKTGRFCSYRPDPRVPIRWESPNLERLGDAR